MEQIRTKVCIVGAGPAGTTASLFLSRYGIPHVIVDRQTFPRDKVCGESFSGMAYHVLRELNLLEPFERDGIISRSWTFSVALHPKENLDIHFPNTATPRIHAMRRHFDFELLRRAESSSITRALTGVNIRSIEVGKDCVTVKDDKEAYCIEADVLINCVGEQVPQLTRLIGKDYITKGLNYVFWRAYFEGVNWPTPTNRPCEIYLFTKPKTMCLIITPLPNGLTTVELGGEQREHTGGASLLEQLCFECIQSRPGLAEKFKNAHPIDKGKGIAINLGPLPRYLADDRMLLAGSATGSINPITGFGVGHAMRSGQLAAAACAQAFEARDFSSTFFRKHYDAVVRKRMQSDYSYGQVLNLLQRFAPYLKPFAGFFLSKPIVMLASHPKFTRQFYNPLFYIRLLLGKERIETKVD